MSPCGSGSGARRLAEVILAFIPVTREHTSPRGESNEVISEKLYMLLSETPPTPPTVCLP